MEDFLKERGIADEVIQRFIKEKIDVNVVSAMTDPQLKEFGVVQFGDRIALRAFASK